MNFIFYMKFRMNLINFFFLEIWDSINKNVWNNRVVKRCECLIGFDIGIMWLPELKDRQTLAIRFIIWIVNSDSQINVRQRPEVFIILVSKRCRRRRQSTLLFRHFVDRFPTLLSINAIENTKIDLMTGFSNVLFRKDFESYKQMKIIHNKNVSNKMKMLQMLE